MARPGAPEIATSVERRRAARTPAVIRIDYGTVDALFSEFTRNINEGGVFIETEQPLGLEERVHLQFRLPGASEPVRATGRVVWVQEKSPGTPGGMGIEFDELDGAARARIDALIQGLRTRRSEPD